MKMSLKVKLLSFFLMVGIIPIIVIGFYSYFNAKSALETASYSQLRAINDIKLANIKSAFGTVKKEVLTISRIHDTHEVFEVFKKFHDEMGVGPTQPYPVSSAAYQKLWKDNYDLLGGFVKSLGFYDIFLICAAHGHVMFSEAKEADLGTNLVSGEYKTSHLAKLWSEVVRTKDYVLVDMAPYAPSKGAPAMFAGAPLMDEAGNILAVVAVQVSTEPINKIMSLREGMGKTGESYLVGSDKLMRSDSFLDPQGHSVEASFKNKTTVDTESIRNALAGQSDTKIVMDYNGNMVLSDFDLLELDSGIKWAIASEIDESEAFASVFNLRFWIFLIVIIVAAIVAVVGLFIGGSIANPILKIADNLKSTASNVASSSSELSGASSQLSEASNVQASSVEETSASLEEITGMVNNNVESAETSTKLSGEMKVTSEKGNAQMEVLIQSMNGILQSNDKIQDLVKVIGEIGEKTAVIDEIVFQTKLLSFNASVEAERAGEHGRGFAVVAQEVGNLAQMSGKAAQEISSIVKNSIKNAEEITSENRKKVEDGNNLVKEVAAVLAQITKNASALAESAQQILGASKDQSAGIVQINDAMGQLDQATQQNASIAEEAASSGEELNAQAVVLNEIVQTLMMLVTGAATENQKSDQRHISKESSHKVATTSKIVKPPQKKKSEIIAPAKFEATHTDDEWDKL